MKGSHSRDHQEFVSTLIRSIQESSSYSQTEIDEFRRILQSPVGDLIVRAALLAASIK